MELVWHLKVVVAFLDGLETIAAQVIVMNRAPYHIFL